MNQKVRFTVSEWKNIEYIPQRELMKRYNIVIVKEARLKKIRYTVKEWKKFSVDIQMFLLRTHDIILTDHMTGRKKMIKLSKKFTIKNLNKGINKTSRGIEAFSKMMDELNFEKGLGKKKDVTKLLWGTKPKKKNSFFDGNKKRDYSLLTRKKLR